VYCRRYGDGESCDYFDWVDESLDERIKSMVVGLMVSNETMAVEIKRLENNLETQKHKLQKMKEKKWKAEVEVVCMAQKVEIVSVFCKGVLIVFVAMYIGYV